jgi:hypothetical protein
MRILSYVYLRVSSLTGIRTLSETPNIFLFSHRHLHVLEMRTPLQPFSIGALIDED